MSSTRKSKAPATPAKVAKSKASKARSAATKSAAVAKDEDTKAASRPKAAKKSPGKSARKSAKAPAKKAPASARTARARTAGVDVESPRKPRTGAGLDSPSIDPSTPTLEIPAGRAKPRTAAQREAAFDTLVRNACLKAGTAAAISSLTRRVPLLGRLAPTLLGPLAETVALAQVQKALVAGVIELYGVELSEPEQRGVVLLATATDIGAQQLSKRSMEAILKQFGDGLVRGIAARVLPVASILAEITAAVASTYTVGKRAQALCKLPGTGAGNLAELLRGLSGIDQARLLNWSGEAFRLALMPFKSVLGLLWR
jgi:uncharacterized protein (DUF697 family)